MASIRTCPPKQANEISVKKWTPLSLVVVVALFAFIVVVVFAVFIVVVVDIVVIVVVVGCVVEDAHLLWLSVTARCARVH